MVAVEKERQRVRRSRSHNPRRPHRITDYSAVVVACGYERGSKIYDGFSKSPVGYDYVPRLRDRLNALAPIGEKRLGCENIVGACAEPHAANAVLREYHGCRMSELQFSDAYRPRTARRKRNCDNCKDVFSEVL